jgi:hypothetical protein
MTIDRINRQSAVPSTAAGKEKAKEQPVPQAQDQVTLSGGKDELPKIIVGAPTGRLSPRIDTPNVHPSPIAIEITNGVGIGIDGESIIVAPGKEGEIEIIGHLEDGTYPQRDYKVTRKGETTVVDGYYNWQDYKITKSGDRMHIAGETPRETFDVVESGSGFKVSGQYPVQNYDVTFKGNETKVDNPVDIDDAYIVTKGNVTTIKGAHEERDFTITRESNHMKIDGRYAFQDFDITWNDKEIVVKGHYPHQTQIIRFK